MIKQSDDCAKITFECRLVADPSPTLQWYHEGTLIKESSRHKCRLLTDKHNQVASLLIEEVTAADGGEYKVVAKNKHGEGTATINLNFDEGKPQVPDGKPPRFPKKPAIRQKGSTLVLECQLEANPFPEITWYHGTKMISEGSRHKATRVGIGQDSYTLALEIMNPTIEDGGTYRCNAVNELGESNANIALNFQGIIEEEEDLSPTFISKPKIIPKDSGKMVVLEFKVKSKSKVTTKWYKETTLVRESTKVKSVVVADGEDAYTIRLEIKVRHLAVFHTEDKYV